LWPEWASERGPLLAGAIVLLAISRAGELWVSRRNLRALRASGVAWRAASSAREYGLMVCVHALFLIAAPCEYVWRGAHGPSWAVPIALLGLLGAQALRYGSIAALGRRWNARGIVAPALGAVHSGPYRFLRHPNYFAVFVEFAALPWVAGTFWSGAVLFVVNAWLLVLRTRQERLLMAEVPGWQR
jgi:methyltransferase